MDLPPGNYQFSVTKPGYMKGELGQRWAGSTLPIEVPPFVPYLRGQALTLGAGERRSDITIRLWKEGAITGGVVDEFGEPVVGILVQAWAERFQAGRAMLESALPVIGRTDDRGVYRMIEGAARPVCCRDRATASRISQRSGAAAEIGPFWARTSSPSELVYRSRPLAGSAGAVKVGDWLQWISAAVGPTSSSDGGHSLSYPTIFYANAASPADASPVTVPPGDDASGVDFQLARERCTACPVASLDPTVRRQRDAALDLDGPGASSFPTARTATAVSDAQGGVHALSRAARQLCGRGQRGSAHGRRRGLAAVERVRLRRSD